MAKTAEKPEKLIAIQTKLPEDEVRLLDEARRLEEDLPSRADLMRRILRRHLEKVQKKLDAG